MKKIIAVSVVKNECDIIESFCRYIVSYCNLLIIQDDSSTDNTKSILNALILEGLPIVFSRISIIEKNEFRLPQVIIMNQLVNEAFKTFGADIVIPADADEFIVADDGTSPRAVLEHLEDNKGYRIRWRTYIYNNPQMVNDVFLPEHFPLHRKPELEYYYKVIITRQLYANYGCKLTQGNHNLTYPNQQKSAPMNDIADLYVAHYPIRSVSQLTAKVVNGWYSYLASPSRGKKWGYHWEKIYKKIKESGTLSECAAKETSIHYSISEKIILEEDDYLAIYGPARTNFLEKCIKLKYTDYSLIQPPSWGNILENTEQLIMFLVQKQSNIVRLLDIAEREITSMKSSRSWKITSPLRKVGQFYRKCKAILNAKFENKRMQI